MVTLLSSSVILACMPNLPRTEVGALIGLASFIACIAMLFPFYKVSGKHKLRDKLYLCFVYCVFGGIAFPIYILDTYVLLSPVFLGEATFYSVIEGIINCLVERWWSVMSIEWTASCILTLTLTYGHSFKTGLVSTIFLPFFGVGTTFIFFLVYREIQTVYHIIEAPIENKKEN